MPAAPGQPLAGPAALTAGRATVAGCVITLNEERRLPACLESLAFCDEVIVVDSGSSDGTVAVARAAGATVLEHVWQGFAAQRNVALAAVSADWVIELDADERLGPAAQRELQELLSDPPGDVDMVMVPAREQFLGRTLGPSAHYPFYRPRVFRRGSYRHDEERAVHEGLTPGSRPWALGSDMYHLRAESLAEAIRDAVAYARLEASQLTAVTLRGLASGALVRPAFKFVYQWLGLGGWRDGWTGLVKISLDSAGDALTWALAARNGVNVAVTGEATRHFGRRRARAGPVRIAVVGPLDEPARSWVEQAQRPGCWITLISTDLEGPFGCRSDAGHRPPCRLHRLRGMGPLSVLRALDMEFQLGPWDLIVATRPTMRRFLSRLPSSIRSESPVLALGPDALEALERLRGERLAADRG